MSPSTLKLATTLSLPSALCASTDAKAKGAISAAARNERRYMRTSLNVSDAAAAASCGAERHTSA